MVAVLEEEKATDSTSLLTRKTRRAALLSEEGGCNMDMKTLLASCNFAEKLTDADNGMEVGLCNT